MALHTKYRPKTLDKLIGQTTAVTRLKGIISSGKVPSAMLFTGPTSVGKTTLARAFACDLSGKGEVFLNSPDYKEINFSDTRGIDDIRELIRITRFKPQMGKYRVIVGDECQGLLTGGNAAANAVLKALEESENTVWILCSMNPEKFQTTTIGKAIANRCVQFNLEPPSNGELLKQAKRICRGEHMDYMIDEESKLLKTIVKNSNYEMRTLAQLIEACQQYYEGLAEKPQQLSLKDISSVLTSVESSEDQLAQKFICGLYALQFSVCQRCILDSNDHIGLLNKLSFINSYLVNSTILGSEKHRKVWNTSANVAVKKQVQKLNITLGQLAEVNTRLVETKSQAMQFGVGADALLSAFAYSTIRKLQEMQK